MNYEELIDRYLDSWNARDIESVLELMHPGAAYYDAFWMETCVGRDLAQYLRDSMHAEDLWYVRSGDVITTTHAVIYRYDAHEHAAGDVGEAIYRGAEILRMHDDRILTVSNIYCSPVESDLIELAELTADRHGLTRHANDGLSALKAARIRKALADSLDRDRVYADPDLGLPALADTVGCTPEQLQAVLKSHYRTGFEEFVDSHRIEYAKQKLLGEVDDPRFIEDIAARSGFHSAREFRNKFAEVVGVTPKAYRSRERKRARPD